MGQRLGNLIFEHLVSPLKFRKLHFDRHMVHRFDASPANAFLTFAWEIPNCRAILAGVIPALKAARTAFTCPRVNETSATWACRRLSLDGDRFGAGSGRTFNRWCKVCKSASTAGGNLPRRFISSRVAPHIKSNSLSLKCLTALGKSFGKTCRCGGGSAVSVAEGLCGGADTSWAAWVTKRSGEGCSLRCRAIAGLWR